MKKIISVSLVSTTVLFSAEVHLSPISVESTQISEVSKKAQTSADLADTLSKYVPSIDMSRRSGIANDVLLRGQKRDNIAISVDGTKVCGACPNRMDPPVSHILASQIEEIEVVEGPYDVTEFGTMSGGIKITTKKPSKDLSGEVNFGFGSWNYTKVGATVSGGNDVVRVLVSGSSESSNQYEDGDGNTMAQQLANNPAAGAFVYQPTYEDMAAYKKKSLMAKMYVNVTDDQEIQLGVTQNRSDNVLYPNSKMDAIYDNSNIYSVAYDIKNISDMFVNANLQYYYSDVDHPMSTEYRKASVASGTKVSVSQLQTTMQGLKLKNNFDVYGHEILFGLDTSKRTWTGLYYMNGNVIPDSATKSSTSIDNAVTRNMAVFAKLKKSFGELDVEIGARYDSTKITQDNANMQNNDYEALNANILTTYNLDKASKLFLGLGQASRVPDARELYFVQNSPLPAPAGRIKTTGTDDLKQVTNREIDLGYELDSDLLSLKIKGFYSMYEDYIYYNKDLANNNFVNIDATVYGAEFSSSVYATDEISLDASIAYKVGKKDKALSATNTDLDLADIAPLNGSIAVNYEYLANSIATLEVEASDSWDNYDSDNGEQKLDAWSVVNMKVKHAVSKNFDFTLGVNNILDETYAKSNTYVDLILLSGGADTMLMNEPGRYVYTNLDFKF